VELREAEASEVHDGRVLEMGDYRARKWKPIERVRDFVEIGKNERQVVVKPSLRFDEEGRLVR